MFASASPGSLKMPEYAIGDLLPGEWWRVEVGGVVLGYGWMDTTWGGAEILLVVYGEHRRRGVGTFILDHLEKEAAARGLDYLHNVVPPEHPDAEGIRRWLRSRDFEPVHDDRLMRKVVHRD